MQIIVLCTLWRTHGVTISRLVIMQFTDTYLKEITQPHYVRFRIANHFALNDDRVAFKGLTGAWLLNEQRLFGISVIAPQI